MDLWTIKEIGEQQCKVLIRELYEPMQNVVEFHMALQF